MNFKKTTFKLLVVAGITCMSMTACLSFPQKDEDKNFSVNYSRNPQISIEEHSVTDTTMYSTVTCEDFNGDIYWKYTTKEYEDTQVTEVNSIATVNDRYIFNDNGTIIALNSETGDIVWKTKTFSYINEIRNWGNMYIFNSEGTIYSLDLETGDILWENSDFGGQIAIAELDENAGNLFITGYYGPDFYVIDVNGKTIHKIEKFDSNYNYPMYLTKGPNTVKVVLSNGPEGDGEYTFSVNLTDYSYELEESEIW